MKNLQIALLGEYSNFLLGLRKLDEKVFIEPIAEGKWSVRDMVAHIMMWDKNCVEKTLKSLNKGQQAELKEDVDPQSFNERSVAYGRTLTQREVLDQSLYYRSELIFQLTQLPAETFEADNQAINSMTLSEFIDRLFISHDQHHMKQIEAFLSRLSRAGD